MGCLMLGRGIALVLCFCSTLLFSSLHAEPTSPRDLARLHYQAGRAHLERGEFAEAIREFETGYKIKPLPLFLYNIAQVERVAGQTQRALEDYERYLKAEPSAPDRADVERWIALLRQSLREAPTPAPPATAAEPADGGAEPATTNPAGAPLDGGAEAATNPPPAGATPTPANGDVTPPSARVPLTAPNAAISAPEAAAPRHPPEKQSRRKLWIAVGTVGGVLVVGAVVTAIAVTLGGGNGVPSGYNNWGALDYHH
jgi:tetratricopeptide (TPR) repeat protein